MMIFSTEWGAMSNEMISGSGELILKVKINDPYSSPIVCHSARNRRSPALYP